MDIAFKEKFLKLWKKYFNNAPLPITFYYTDKPANAEIVKPGSVPRCIIGGLVKVQHGESLAFDAKAIGCEGGKRCLGFGEMNMPSFEYFLSYGIPGKLEGERYKKTPEMVKEYMKKGAPNFNAPAKYIVFKRWDKLDKDDAPEVVIFYAEPDVLSGLFTLAVYDEIDPAAVAVPFSSGCGSIIQYSYLETKSEHPRSFIGMFDSSARPFVDKNTLAFSTPMSKFKTMVDNMEESFLITPSWAKIQKRIK
jgi:uncharacterized protein (DUF169 family)